MGLGGLTASTSNIPEQDLPSWVTGRCIVTMSVPFGSQSLSRICTLNNVLAGNAGLGHRFMTINGNFPAMGVEFAVKLLRAADDDRVIG